MGLLTLKQGKWNILFLFGYPFLILIQLSLCTGESRVIGSSSPIYALVGDDVILPCHLLPAKNAEQMTVEWSKPDLKPADIILLHRDGFETYDMKNPSYTYKTTLFREELKNGNVSLRLSSVTLDNAGEYRCFLPSLKSQKNETIIKLVVGAVSQPTISLVGVRQDNGGVVLQCEAKGWYPQPEVEWRDSEGNILFARFPKTDVDNDGTYAVKWNVTVEQTDTNRFTCRVQQREINQVRETEIHVPDYVYVSCTCSAEIVIAIICAVLSLVLAAVFLRNQIQAGEICSYAGKRVTELQSALEISYSAIGKMNIQLDDLHSQLQNKDNTICTLQEQLQSKDNTICTLQEQLTKPQSLDKERQQHAFNPLDQSTANPSPLTTSSSKSLLDNLKPSNPLHNIGSKPSKLPHIKSPKRSTSGATSSTSVATKTLDPNPKWTFRPRSASNPGIGSITKSLTRTPSSSLFNNRYSILEQVDLDS